MTEEKVKIGDREVVVKEITYLDAVEIEEQRQKNMRQAIEKLIELSTGLTKEEVSKISMSEGLALQEKINKINNLGDFRIPIEENQS